MADKENTPLRSTKGTDVRYYAPDVDVYETDDKLVLLMDIPGVTNPEIDVDGNELTVTARTEYAEPDSAKIALAEFGPRNFRRSFSLPAGIDYAGVQAKANNGVLRVDLPKSDEAKIHKIKVQSD